MIGWGTLTRAGLLEVKKVIWINGHKLETVASWSGRAAACTDIYAFQTAVVESMSFSGCPACCSLTEHSLCEVRRVFCPSSPPIPAQKTSNKAKFGWVCTEMSWSVHMHPPANLQVFAPKHRRTQVVQTGRCQNCSTQAEQLPLPHLASSLETNSIKHFGWNSSHPAIFCLK